MSKTLYETGLYELIEHPTDAKAWAVAIKKGEWKGITYSYGKLQIIEDENQEFATMKFDVIILDVPDYIKSKEFPKDQQDKFYETAHKILCEELKNYFEEKDLYNNIVEKGKDPIKFEYDK